MRPKNFGIPEKPLFPSEKEELLNLLISPAEDQGSGAQDKQTITSLMNVIKPLYALELEFKLGLLPEDDTALEIPRFTRF